MNQLGIARIVEMEGQRAVAEGDGHRSIVSISLVPDAQVGDLVFVHKGFVVKRVESPDQPSASEPPAGLLDPGI